METYATRNPYEIGAWFVRIPVPVIFQPREGIAYARADLRRDLGSIVLMPDAEDSILAVIWNAVPGTRPASEVQP